eukprot:EC096931.1.p1 GENE.EC096931.1~~EC096931.1.p1  ORF type:complete len:139 (-),score=13.69 EC096931.1:39-455(-)
MHGFLYAENPQQSIALGNCTKSCSTALLDQYNSKHPPHQALTFFIQSVLSQTPTIFAIKPLLIQLAQLFIYQVKIRAAGIRVFMQKVYSNFFPGLIQFLNVLLKNIIIIQVAKFKVSPVETLLFRIFHQRAKYVQEQV